MPHVNWRGPPRLGDALIDCCAVETGLPRGRIEAKRDRAIGQLHMLANAVRAVDLLEARVDPALPAQRERKPLPSVYLRLRHIGLGPVVEFGASNFRSPFRWRVVIWPLRSRLAHSMTLGTCESVENDVIRWGIE